VNLTITHKGLANKIVSQAVITSVDSGKSVKVAAIWDTGATTSLVNDKIVKSLQLKEIGIAQVKHVAGATAFPIHLAAIEIEGGMKITEHRLVSFPSIHAFDMIIGMDIIVLGKFCIENEHGNTVFSFKL
jgi:prophage DNA circulation protein